MKKFVSDFDDFGVNRLLSTSTATFVLAVGFKANIPEIVWTNAQRIYIFSMMEAITPSP
jgi:hypothetical protein